MPILFISKIFFTFNYRINNMGFIFGIILFDKKPVQRKEIEALGGSTGWDNFNRQLVLENSIAFGYCHHPDRRPKAGYYQDDDLIIIADIRIYNAVELKQSFNYQTDEEAIAKAYRLWGTDCANHINGDFAACIFDRRSQKTHLFRDHIGVRPLVYQISENRLVFASHEYGLVKSGLCPTTLSERKFIDQLWRYSDSYEQTVFESIKKVMPGYCVTSSIDGSMHSAKYWKPENIQINSALSFDSAVTGLRELLVAATCSRMENVKTGMHVSGGIDSCGIASIVADHTSDKSRLTGYSWTPEIFDSTIDGINEKEFIDAFSSEKIVPVRYLSLQKYELAQSSILPEFPNQYIELPVMKMAQEDDTEILFSGWGGDEFVSLSTRGTINHLFFKFKWMQLIKFAQKKGIRALVGQLRTDVFPFLVPLGLLPVYKAGRKDWSNLFLLKPGFVWKHRHRIFLYKQKAIFGYGNRTKFMLNLLELHHLPDRMDSWAINAERYGFEYKYPLLDKELLEFWFSIPTEYTYRDFIPRLLYREAMKGLMPEKIRTRKDKGEAIRIAFTFRETQNGREYLEKLFDSLSDKEHFTFIKPGKIRGLFHDYDSKSLHKKIKAIRKTTLYLRYINLAKTYLSGLGLTNTQQDTSD